MPLGGLLGASWGPLGGLLGPLGGLLGLSWDPLGGPLGASWALLGAFGSVLGAILEATNQKKGEPLFVYPRRGAKSFKNLGRMKVFGYRACPNPTL